MLLLEGIQKVYNANTDDPVFALRNIDLVIEDGEFVAIMGASGSGKSTLMHILGCLDRPTAGRYVINGEDVSQLDNSRLADIRNRLIGFVFQSFNLIPRCTALHNVEMPLIYAGVGKGRHERATEALRSVGLEHRANHMPSALSGGQQQRVAIARALVTNPALILADEPTGNLDSQSSADIMHQFTDLHRAGRTIVLITHEADIAAYASRVVRVRDGLIVEDTPTPHPALSA
ncbi:MAG: ABC transporter ATP-binding protein [Candidatus Dormibacteria bacterium]